MSSPAALPEPTPTSHGAATPSGWWAVCLCAAWCGTCGIYRPLFDEFPTRSSWLPVPATTPSSSTTIMSAARAENR